MADNQRYQCSDSSSLFNIKQNFNHFLTDFYNTDFTSLLDDGNLTLTSGGVLSKWTVNNVSTTYSNEISTNTFSGLDSEIKQGIKAKLETESDYTLVIYASATVSGTIKFSIDPDDSNDITNLLQDIVAVSGTVSQGYSTHIIQFRTSSVINSTNIYLSLKNIVGGSPVLSLKKMFLYKGLIELSNLPSMKLKITTTSEVSGTYDPSTSEITLDLLNDPISAFSVSSTNSISGTFTKNSHDGVLALGLTPDVDYNYINNGNDGTVRALYTSTFDNNGTLQCGSAEITCTPMYDDNGNQLIGNFTISYPDFLLPPNVSITPYWYSQDQKSAINYTILNGNVFNLTQNSFDLIFQAASGSYDPTVPFTIQINGTLLSTETYTDSVTATVASSGTTPANNVLSINVNALGTNNITFAPATGTTAVTASVYNNKNSTITMNFTITAKNSPVSASVKCTAGTDINTYPDLTYSTSGFSDLYGNYVIGANQTADISFPAKAGNVYDLVAPPQAAVYYNLNIVNMNVDTWYGYKGLRYLLNGKTVYDVVNNSKTTKTISYKNGDKLAFILYGTNTHWSAAGNYFYSVSNSGDTHTSSLDGTGISKTTIPGGWFDWYPLSYVNIYPNHTFGLYRCSYFEITLTPAMGTIYIKEGT